MQPAITALLFVFGVASAIASWNDNDVIGAFMSGWVLSWVAERICNIHLNPKA